MKIVISKKCLSVLITVFILTIIPISLFINVKGFEPITGSCGINAEFNINENGLLEIKGSGNIDDFTPSTIPWKDHYLDIQSLKISDSITGIGINSFLNLAILSVDIPSSVISIGPHSIGYTYDYDSETYEKIIGFEINGINGSEAQKYAESNGFIFNSIDSEMPSGKLSNNLKWDLNSNGVLTVSGNGPMPDYTASSDAPWSKYYEKTDGFLITSIVISDGVTSVGNFSFADCSSAESLSLGSNLLKIGNSAFENCSSLKSVVIPGSVSSIGSNAFCGCLTLSEVDIQNGVSHIGVSAFSVTGIKEITLPNSVSVLGNKVFLGCENLINAKIPSISVIPLKAFAECTSLESVSVGSSLTNIGVSAFEGCISLIDFSFTAPLKIISERAFYSCTSLSSVSLPQSLEFLKEYAFYGCSGISTLIIGDGIKTIDECTFEGCTSLSSVDIGDSVNYIAERAFTNCPNLRSINIPSTVKFIAPYSIGYYYFEDPEHNVNGTYTKYDGFIPEIISRYPSRAQLYAIKNEFTFTSLGLILSDNGDITDTSNWSVNTTTDVLMISGSGILPDYISFDETPWAVYRDYIKNVVYGSGILNVGISSFEGCSSIIGITLSDTIERIGDWAFSGTSVQTLNLPIGIKTINDGAFEGCAELCNIILPDSLQYLGQFAFRGPNKLNSLYLSPNVGFIGSYAVGFSSDNKPIDGFCIRGVKDSVAYNYAKINSIDFVEDGYVEISDDKTGCTISIVGSDKDDYTLSFQNIKKTLEPEIFLADTEYALVYEIVLKSGDSVISSVSSALISFPIPENINPIGIKIYYTSDCCNFQEIEFRVENHKIVLSYGLLGKFVITNADLSSLYTITVNHKFEDGSEAHPTQIYHGTKGANYTVKYIETDGYVPSEKVFSDVISDDNINICFTYKIKEVSDTTVTDFETEPIPKPKRHNSIKIILIIVEIILILGIISAVTALIVINNKKKKEANKNVRSSGSTSKRNTDKFADTIVVPDAPTREIDIQSLFADEPEEDIEETEHKKIVKHENKSNHKKIKRQ